MYYYVTGWMKEGLGFEHWISATEERLTPPRLVPQLDALF